MNKDKARKTEVFYIATPVDMYQTGRYHEAFYDLTRPSFPRMYGAPEERWIEPAKKNWTFAEWQKRWPRILSRLDVLYVVPRADFSIGRGCWLEIEDCKRRGIPVFVWLHNRLQPYRLDLIPRGNLQEWAYFSIAYKYYQYRPLRYGYFTAPRTLKFQSGRNEPCYLDGYRALHHRWGWGPVLWAESLNRDKRSPEWWEITLASISVMAVMPHADGSLDEPCAQEVAQALSCRLRPYAWLDKQWYHIVGLDNLSIVKEPISEQEARYTT
jgi:hypothetical protein